MKTNTLFLIGTIVGLVFIFSQLKPQEIPFYKEKGNYVVDNNHLIKDVKKLSDQDVSTLISYQKKYDRVLGKNILVNVITRNHILKGCLETANIDWKKFGDLKPRVDNILKKYGARELNKNYYSIQNDQIVTNAVLLKQNDLATLSNSTIRGAGDVQICIDMSKYAKISKFFKVSKINNNIDPKINKEFEKVLATYR